MGRKTILTNEVADAIVTSLRIGAFKKHAANAAGVSEATLRIWLERGAAGEEPYATFADNCEQAIAQDALRNQAAISRAATGKAEGDWKAAAWNLEKKFPKLYGRAAELGLIPPQADSSERPHSPWLKPTTEPKAAH